MKSFGGMREKERICYKRELLHDESIFEEAKFEVGNEIIVLYFESSFTLDAKDAHENEEKKEYDK